MDAERGKRAAVEEAATARTVAQIEDSAERRQRLAVNSIENNASTWIKGLLEVELVHEMVTTGDEARAKAAEALWKDRAAMRKLAEAIARHSTRTAMADPELKTLSDRTRARFEERYGANP